MLPHRQQPTPTRTTSSRRADHSPSIKRRPTMRTPRTGTAPRLAEWKQATAEDDEQGNHRLSPTSCDHKRRRLPGSVGGSPAADVPGARSYPPSWIHARLAACHAPRTALRLHKTSSADRDDRTGEISRMIERADRSPQNARIRGIGYGMALGKAPFTKNVHSDVNLIIPRGDAIRSKRDGRSSAETTTLRFSRREQFIQSGVLFGREQQPESGGKAKLSLLSCLL